MLTLPNKTRRHHRRPNENLRIHQFNITGRSVGAREAEARQLIYYGYAVPGRLIDLFSAADVITRSPLYTHRRVFLFFFFLWQKKQPPRFIPPFPFRLSL